jgi:hypothetical protein
MSRDEMRAEEMRMKKSEYNRIERTQDAEA